MASQKPSHNTLSREQVRHIAKLARLRLSESQIDEYQAQLATILDHVAQLNAIDVTGVEPMAHPISNTNRLDEDDVSPSMPIESLLMNAPALEDRYLAVPKVLDEQ